jgi:uncharacterized membrane protein
MPSQIYRCLSVILLVFGLGLISPNGVSAHAEHHQPTTTKAASSSQPGASVTPNEPIQSASSQETHSEPDVPTTEHKDNSHQTKSSSPHPGHDHEVLTGPSSWSKALWGHWHHKVIHFPIALGVFAALLLFGGLKWDFCYPVAGVALGIAFVFGIVAYFSGQSMLADFSENSPYLPLVERHRQLGIASIVFLGLGTVGVCFERMQAWMWIYALVLLSLISVTGFYGGWIAHG